jgi:hypothetical protein
MTAVTNDHDAGAAAAAKAAAAAAAEAARRAAEEAERKRKAAEEAARKVAEEAKRQAALLAEQQAKPEEQMSGAEAVDGGEEFSAKDSLGQPERPTELSDTAVYATSTELKFAIQAFDSGNMSVQDLNNVLFKIDPDSPDNIYDDAAGSQSKNTLNDMKEQAQARIKSAEPELSERDTQAKQTLNQLQLAMMSGDTSIDRDVATTQRAGKAPTVENLSAELRQMRADGIDNRGLLKEIDHALALAADGPSGGGGDGGMSAREVFSDVGDDANYTGQHMRLVAQLRADQKDDTDWNPITALVSHAADTPEMDQFALSKIDQYEQTVLDFANGNATRKDVQTAFKVANSAVTGENLLEAKATEDYANIAADTADFISKDLASQGVAMTAFGSAYLASGGPFTGPASIAAGTKASMGAVASYTAVVNGAEEVTRNTINALNGDAALSRDIGEYALDNIGTLFNGMKGTGKAVVGSALAGLGTEMYILGSMATSTGTGGFLGSLSFAGSAIKAPVLGALAKGATLSAVPLVGYNSLQLLNSVRSSDDIVAHQGDNGEITFSRNVDKNTYEALANGDITDNIVGTRMENGELIVTYKNITSPLGQNELIDQDVIITNNNLWDIAKQTRINTNLENGDAVLTVQNRSFKFETGFKRETEEDAIENAQNAQTKHRIAANVNPLNWKESAIKVFDRVEFKEAGSWQFVANTSNYGDGYVPYSGGDGQSEITRDLTSSDNGFNWSIWNRQEAYAQAQLVGEKQGATLGGKAGLFPEAGFWTSSTTHDNVVDGVISPVANAIMPAAHANDVISDGKYDQASSLDPVQIRQSNQTVAKDAISAYLSNDVTFYTLADIGSAKVEQATAVDYNRKDGLSGGVQPTASAGGLNLFLQSGVSTTSLDESKIMQMVADGADEEDLREVVDAARDVVKDSQNFFANIGNGVQAFAGRILNGNDEQSPPQYADDTTNPEQVSDGDDQFLDLVDSTTNHNEGLVGVLNIPGKRVQSDMAS